MPVTVDDNVEAFELIVFIELFTEEAKAVASTCTLDISLCLAVVSLFIAVFNVEKLPVTVDDNVEAFELIVVIELFTEEAKAVALASVDILDATSLLIAELRAVTSDSSSAVIFAIVDDSAMTSTLSRLARLSKSVLRVSTSLANVEKDELESAMFKSVTVIEPPTDKLEEREKPPSKLREMEPDMNIT